jgi:ribosome-associated protein
MTSEELRERIPVSQFSFTASRSSGPGGQNVNKVSTKVEVRFCITRSPFLSNDEKEKILIELSGRINSEGEVIVISQSERTQLMNRKRAEEKLFQLLASTLTEKPVRKSTKPTLASKVVRLDKKRKRGNIKKLRSIRDNSDNNA